MHSTERKQFEDELAVLFGGFPQFLTPPRIEAYWRGLAKMSLPVFTRCVNEALSEKGSEKLPTVNTLWQISRTLRAAPSSQPQAQTRQYDKYHLLGQRWLFAFLLQRKGVDDATLQKLIAMKNRVIEQFRESGDIDGNVAEWLDVAMTAFAKVAA